MTERSNPITEPFEAGPVVRAGLARGVALFNRGEYWSSHEAWEEAWHAAPDDQRALIQGLIQMGAAFHKLVVQDNAHGAQRLLARAITKLDGCPEDAFGIAIGPLRSELEGWRQRLTNAPPSPTEPVRGLPRIAWTSEARSATLFVEAMRVHALERGGRRVLIVVAEAAGRFGFGEVALSWRRHGTLRALVESICPAVLAEPLHSPAALALRIGELSADVPARAGVEAAVWDLWARREEQSATAALGIQRRPVSLAMRLHGAEPGVLSSAAAAGRDAGYALLELPARPNADRRMLPALVDGLGCDFAFDLDERYRPADFYALRAIATLGPQWLASPVPGDLVIEMATLRRWLKVPVSPAPVAEARKAADFVAAKALDLLTVDPLLTGPSGALEQAGLAQSRGIPARVSASAVTPIGARLALAVAAHPAFTLPASLGRIPPDAAVEPGWPRPNGDGTATPASGPGLGDGLGAWLASAGKELAWLKA